tara:strand:- start:872 stop:2506 length:1635 start_codon:yes stop_codon:yes gene_type:complete
MIQKFFFTNHKLFFLILLSLFFHLLAAYFSEGYYEQDEHFSILEPITYKLGKNATLGWDFFHNYDKQWFLPFIFYYLIRFFQFFGIESPFQWMLIIRTLSAILGWLSVICLIHIAKRKLNEEKYLNIFIFLSTLFWFYPYIHARPASENISISFLIIGLTLFTYFKINKKIILLCGIIFGLSIITRYTNIFIIGSFGLWAIFFKKIRFSDFILLSLGFLLIFIISILIDIWGYQKNVLVIINYFVLNYHWSHNVNYFASLSQTDYWWYNFYLIFKEFLPPISIIIILSMIIYWIRFPKNLITWISLPYFIFLCTNPHKETRFLFPILMFSPLFLVSAFENFYIRGINITKKIFAFRFNKIIIYFFLFINLISLIILSAIPANNSTLLYKFLYKNEHNINHIYTLNNIPYKKSGLLINFYRNENINFTMITTKDRCKEIESEYKVKFDNYNIENEFVELQKFSFPKWNFKYNVICNKESFIEDFNLHKKKEYYLFYKSTFLNFFNNTQKSQCHLAYSTFPNWLKKINYGNWQRNLSAWYVFECKK